MRHGKRKSPAKQLTAALWILLILAVPGILFGGVVAYLSDSTEELKNEFEVDNMPAVVVAADQKSVTVTSPNYPVYVRVKVVGNKVVGEGVILPGYYECTLTDTTDWFADDGFWYYRKPVEASLTEIELEPQFTVSPDATINMIAQTVQAVGKTDDDAKFAVEDAWPAVKVSTADGTLSKAGS